MTEFNRFDEFPRKIEALLHNRRKVQEPVLDDCVLGTCVNDG